MRPGRRGGSDSDPERPQRKPRDVPKKQSHSGPSANAKRGKVAVGKKAAKAVKTTALVLVATGRFSLKRVVPFVGVLCVRVFGNHKAFQGLSCATFAVNAVKARSVSRSVRASVQQIQQRSGKGPGFWKGGLLSAADATTQADTGTNNILTEFDDASHPLVVLQDKAPFLFHPVLKSIASPTLFIHGTPRVLKIIAPGALRTLRFYGHLLPVIAGYVKCLLLDVGLKKKSLSSEQIQQIWDLKHEWGALKVKTMILDLGGFYLKVGQVFATKSDLLPPQYIAALKSVFDDCPPVDGKVIRKIVQKELKGKVDKLFASFEKSPLATATIAQVHVATLNDGKTKVAVKVQVPGSEKLMAMDMKNMLAVSEFADNKGIKLPFDHTSILKEYRTQVPLEFDFTREANMLTVIGNAIEGRCPDITTPKAIDSLSTKKVLTMSFVEGESLGDIIQRALRAANGGEGEPISSGAGFQQKAAAGMLTKNGTRINGSSLIAQLIESYGTQIFGIGKFHSDPHPGNLLVAPDGKTLSIIDFGQTKVLDDTTRLGICRLILALAADRKDETIAYAKALGLEITGASSDFALTVCYILFDTRMDIEEAHFSPLDADVPPEMRVVKIETIPEEVFMFIRVIALVRGILISLDTDVHARTLWQPYAIQALRAAGDKIPGWALEHEATLNAARKLSSPGTPSGINSTISPSAKTPGKTGTGDTGAIYDKMKTLGQWMSVHRLPANQKTLMPFVGYGLTSVEQIAAAVERNETDKLKNAFRKFSADDAKRCQDLAAEQAAGAAVRLDSEEAAKSGRAAVNEKAKKAKAAKAERELEDKARKAQKAAKASSKKSKSDPGGSDESKLTLSLMMASLRWARRARTYLAADTAAEAVRLKSEEARLARMAEREKAEEAAAIEAEKKAKKADAERMAERIKQADKEAAEKETENAEKENELELAERKKHEAKVSKAKVAKAKAERIKAEEEAAAKKVADELAAKVKAEEEAVKQKAVDEAEEFRKAAVKAGYRRIERHVDESKVETLERELAEAEAGLEEETQEKRAAAEKAGRKRAEAKAEARAKAEKEAVDKEAAQMAATEKAGAETAAIEKAAAEKAAAEKAAAEQAAAEKAAAEKAAADEAEKKVEPTPEPTAEPTPEPTPEAPTEKAVTEPVNPESKVEPEVETPAVDVAEAVSPDPASAEPVPALPETSMGKQSENTPELKTATSVDAPHSSGKKKGVGKKKGGGKKKH